MSQGRIPRPLHWTHRSNFSSASSPRRGPLDPMNPTTFASLRRDPRASHRASDLHRNLTLSLRFQNSHQIKAGHEHCDHEHCVGAEPGVDPRNESSEYSHFKEACVIDIIDYDNEEATFTRMGNDQFIREMAMEVPRNWEDGEDQRSPPLAVRWINIGGIDWNVLRAVALRYDLHSLALEDILHESGHNHSKADYYPEHLFIRVLCHTLAFSDHFNEYSDSPQPLSEDEPQPTVSLPGETLSPQPSISAAELGESRPFKVRYEQGDVIRSSSSATAASASNIDDLVKVNSLDTDSEYLDPTKNEQESPPPKRSRPRDFFSSARNSLKKRLSSLSGFQTPERREMILRIRELKKESRVEVRHKPLFIFLLRNGTVISLHPTPNLHYTTPITHRLHQSDSVLRTSNDASLLVESLLDLVVDRVLEVMNEYQAKIHDLEHKILINPSMNVVRCLHVLSGDLIMHRRTLDPIKTMIFGLRKYDLDRCIALADNMVLAKQQEAEMEEKMKRHKKKRKDKGGHQKKQYQSRAPEAAVSWEPLVPEDHSGHERVRTDDEHLRTRVKAKKQGVVDPSDVQGYFSYKGKVYLADVYDHMDFALTSLDMFSGITENLINYAFNMASYEMNIVMGRLTIVSIIFLPLTLLTGYFGMNFQPFWSVDQNSDVFFWKIAAPMMACLVPIFMFSEFKQMGQNLKRRWQERQVVKHMLKEMDGVGGGEKFDFDYRP